MRKSLFLIFGISIFLFSCDTRTPNHENQSSGEVINKKSITLNTSMSEGLENEYTLFILGDLNQKWTDSRGRIAAAGDINIQGYGVALDQPELTDEYSLVAGGSITHLNGTVYYGNVAYGENYNAQGVSILNGEASQGSPIDFESAEIKLKDLSLRLEEMTANGSNVNNYGALIFTGVDEKLNIFHISSEEIESSHTLDLDIPEGSSAIINVSGTSTTIQYKGMTENFNNMKQHVLFNFPNQTQLTIQGIGFKGSVLVPFAHIVFNWAHIDGQIVAASLEGSGESHYFPFIPIEEDKPEVPEGFQVIDIEIYEKPLYSMHKFVIKGDKFEQVEKVYIDGNDVGKFTYQVNCMVQFYIPELSQGFHTLDFVFINGAEYSYPEGIVIE